MVKKRTDIFLTAINSIKLYIVFFIACLIQFQSYSYNYTTEFSLLPIEIPKICEGDVFIIEVFDIPVNSKVDSVLFKKNNTIKTVESPNLILIDGINKLFVKSDEVGITGDIEIILYVNGVALPQTFFIRIVPKPRITKHPINHYACQGDQVRFNVNGSNYDSIRWEYLDPKGSQWNFYGNENKSELIISANKSLNDKYQFRALLSNENTCFAYSEPAILILDTIPPKVICPNDTTIIIDDASCNYTFEIRPRPLSIYDACGHNESTTRRSDNLQATEPYPLGTTTVTFLVPDKSGNLGQCSYNITIKNNATAKIPCDPEVTLYLDDNCRAQLPNRPLRILPPCAKDSIMVHYQGFINYDRNRLGNHTLRFFSFHDKVEECTTQVTVLDTSKYRLDYEPKDLIHDTDPGKCTKTLLPDPPRISNLCTPNRDKVELLNDWPENNEFQIGTTEIHWGIIQYDGKVDTIKQLITINDVSAPTVVCPDPVEVVLDPGECSGWVDISPLDEGNACGKVDVLNNRTNTRDASGDYPAGVSNISWTVTHNNSPFASCPQQVVVKTTPVAHDDYGRTSQDEPVTINILDNDMECYQPEQLQVSVTSGTTPANGKASINSQKNLTYIPSLGFFGIDSIRYIIENSFGISATATVYITVTEIPELNCTIISSGDVSGFGASDGWATVEPVGGVPPFSISWNNGQSSETAINLTSGNYQVTLTDSKNQITSCNVFIDEPEKLVCHISQMLNPSEHGQSDGVVGVTVSGGIPPYSFLWNTGETLDVLSGLPAGTYQVTITDTNNFQTNCVAELTEPPLPHIPCIVLIPDGFSPNGDGIGDRFYIRCIEEYPNASIQIYNRYGQLLYHRDNYGNTEIWGETDAYWDGRPNKGIKPFNSILPSGTYYYVFNPGDGSLPITGSIYLNTNREGMQ